MATIRRPTKRTPQGSVGRIIFIILVLAQLLALYFFFFQTPSIPQGSNVESFLEILSKSRIELSDKRISKERQNVEDKEQDAKDNPHHSEESRKEDQEKEKEADHDDQGVNSKETPDDPSKAAEEQPVQGDSISEVTVQGNHVTARGYVAEYMYEREHPRYRQQPLVLENVTTQASIVAKLVFASKLDSCEYMEGRRILTKAKCHNDDAAVVFNSQSFPRTWCGKLIAPNTAEKMEGPCTEPVRIFPMDFPPVSGENMPPIVIKENMDSMDLEEVECNIPCKQQRGMNGKQRFIEGTSWKITHSMDDPYTSPDIHIEQSAFRQDEYHSTTSFRSNVPLSFFNFEEFDIRKPAINYNDALPSASYLVDKRCSSQGSRRNRWVGAVAVHFPVASYGNCEHNTDIPDGMSLSNRTDRIALHKKHRINLAFEASNEKDHITELVWEAFQSGAVPVVLGAANIRDHFPPKSLISGGDYQTWDALGADVKKIAENETLWNSFQEWRTNPEATKAFMERYQFTTTTPSCRMCRWAYAKKYGLGWHHEQQVVQNPVIPRKSCFDADSKLVTSPFIESWVTKDGPGYGQEVCPSDLSSCSNEDSKQATIKLENCNIDRSVQSHDSVTDFIVTRIDREQSRGDIIMRLEFNVTNSEGAYFRDPHMLIPTKKSPLCSSMAIQDERSKVTVLANWDTEIRSTTVGIIDIVIHSRKEGVHEDEFRKVRVITEDTNSLVDKLTEFYPSSFGLMMTQDFTDPLEVFYMDD